MSGNANSGAAIESLKIKPWRRRLNLIAGLAILASMAYCVGLYATAESRVSKVCAKFTPGLDIAAATKIAIAHGMIGPGNMPITFVMETATYGRYGCKLEFKDGILVRASYDFHS